MTEPLPIGTVVVLGSEDWEISAVSFQRGERYYFLTRGENEVTFYPAFMLEDDRVDTPNLLPAILGY